jgi:hypothetical protein
MSVTLITILALVPPRYVRAKLAPPRMNSGGRGAGRQGANSADHIGARSPSLTIAQAAD